MARRVQRAITAIGVSRNCLHGELAEMTEVHNNHSLYRRLKSVLHCCWTFLSPTCALRLRAPTTCGRHRRRSDQIDDETTSRADKKPTWRHFQKLSNNARRESAANLKGGGSDGWIASPQKVRPTN